MKKITRRDSLRYITVASVSAGLLTSCESDGKQQNGHEHVHESIDGLYGLSEEDKQLLKEKFFTDEERETVRVLANLIIPVDAGSGNAEAAGTVVFIEFMMLDYPKFQVPMQGGLKWLDRECLDRFGQNFSACNDAQQKEILEDIAYPEDAPPEMSQGVAFFNQFRNLVATGFWTSKIGIEDLQYMGNKPNVWNGAPQEWLDRLGVSYDS